MGDKGDCCLGLGTKKRVFQMKSFVNDGSTGVPVDYHVSSLWEALTGQRTENMQNLKETLIHHPEIRILKRFLSYTLNSRAVTNKSNNKDPGLPAKAG